MKAQIKIRYRLGLGDWSEETFSYDFEDADGSFMDLGNLLASTLKKSLLEPYRVHMVMEQTTFNHLARVCAILGCVDIEGGLEIMKKFNVVWFDILRYIPVYFTDDSV